MSPNSASDVIASTLISCEPQRTHVPGSLSATRYECSNAEHECCGRPVQVTRVEREHSRKMSDGARP